MQIIPTTVPLVVALMVALGGIVLSTLVNYCNTADISHSFLASRTTIDNGGKQLAATAPTTANIDNNNIDNRRYWENQRKIKQFQSFRRQNITTTDRLINKAASPTANVVIPVYPTKVSSNIDNSSNKVVDIVDRNSRIFKRDDPTGRSLNNNAAANNDKTSEIGDKLEEISDNNIDRLIIENDNDDDHLKWNEEKVIGNSSGNQAFFAAAANGNTTIINTTSPTIFAVNEADNITNDNANGLVIGDGGNNKAVQSTVELLNAFLQCFKSGGYLLTCFNERILSLFKVWKQTFSSKMMMTMKNSSLTTIATTSSTSSSSSSTSFSSSSSSSNNSKNSISTNSSSSSDDENIEGSNSVISSSNSKTIYQIFGNFFGVTDQQQQQLEDKARDSSTTDSIRQYFGDITDMTDSAKEDRGHHKKKKVHKEIKKIILKIILAIFLFKLKIKMILGMIQSILVSKLIFAATLYVLTYTFKIWYDIKQSKLHHQQDKHVVYYDNAHHDHSYDLPEHEYDESYASPLHHSSSSSSSGIGGIGSIGGIASGTGVGTSDSSWGGGWGSLWGRSYPSSLSSSKRTELNGAAPANGRGGGNRRHTMIGNNMPHTIGNNNNNIFKRPTGASAMPVFNYDKSTTIPDFARLDEEEFD